MSALFSQFQDNLREACVSLYGNDLVSVVLYGSWAREAATPASDVDVLVIASVLPPSRGKRMRQFEVVDAATLSAREALWGPPHPAPEISPLIKTPIEVEAGSPLFLDMTEWSVSLFDRDHFFETYLNGLRERMRANGTRRCHAKGGYYWNYKPDIQPGEVVTL